ncbi:uncharacterized protein LOC135690936 [Rhopilema esculentum]|uniref:uncharacterized protein LOC135690936 n=1 Tax=Rhopilema esculentum TaxID=499914 RepID=UPI0031D99A79
MFLGRCWHSYWTLFLLLFALSSISCHQSNDFCERDEKTGSCKKKDSTQDLSEDEPCWDKEETSVKPDSLESQQKLVRLDGVKVGHEQFIEVDGTRYKFITKSMRPLLFEIPNFISKDEAEEIKERAQLTGMFDSKAKGGLTEPDFFKPSGSPGISLGPSGKFDFWDWNRDGVIDMKDIKSWTRYYSFIVMNETDIHDMFKAIDFEHFDDGVITKDEFLILSTQGVDDYINQLVRDHPRFRQRYSEQAFLSMSKSFSKTLHLIRERVVKLTKLPRKIVYGSEHMQVVKYTTYGHYHAHHDSETHTRTDVPCCHMTDTETVLKYGTCKLCRFVTIMAYLNDVEEGGETAFPAADNATYDYNSFRKKGKGPEDSKDLYNLSHNCYSSNLVVTPRAGTAVMWYNHLVDEKTGWLGELEDRSLHGGCDVKRGEKWIANIWLTAPYADSVDMPSMYFDEEDYLEAQKLYLLLISNMLFWERFGALFTLFVSTLALKENHFCEKDEATGLCKETVNDESAPCWYFDPELPATPAKEEAGKLVMLDGVKVGHEQEVTMADRKFKLITRSMLPPLFEIPDFLENYEIDNIILQAEDSGMFSSKAKGGLTPQDFFKPSKVPGKSLGAAGDFYNWDVNEDGIIDMDDILRWNKFFNFLVLNETDVEEMFKFVGGSEFDDGIITKEEFETLNTQGLEDYINLLIREHPRFRQRYSEQTWLPFEKIYSNVLHNVRERVVNITKLPRKLVYGGEQLQVVKYGPYGHYHSHHDTETHERTDVPCCHQTNVDIARQHGKCRICRFITIMVYLNDVEEGGETAFPAAHNKTYDDDALRVRGDETLPDLLNLSQYCQAANLVITPKKGTAVMWYNHWIDKKSGWLGQRIEQSLHGGCDVKKGEKWIANIWLTAPYADSVDVPSMYFSEHDYTAAETAYNEK